MPRRTVALMVDEDLGLLYWLGKILAENGYQALPASDSRQAVLLVEQLGVKVDLVIVNRRLVGVIDMIKAPNREHSPMDVVVIPNPDFSVAELGPPLPTDPSWRRAWYRKILRTLQEAEVVGGT
jgi:hypothetical protein